MRRIITEEAGWGVFYQFLNFQLSSTVTFQLLKTCFQVNIPRYDFLKHSEYWLTDSMLRNFN